MKKILFLGAPFDLYKGGAEYQYQLLEHCLEGRYSIFYLFRHSEKLVNNKYIVYDYKLRKSYKEHLYTDAVIIYQLIRKLSPDIIYKQGINYITAVGVYYALMNNIKMILHIASQRDIEIVREYKGAKRIFDLMHNKIAKYVVLNTSKIVCQANYQNDLLKKNFNRVCDAIIPNFHPLPLEDINRSIPIKIVWVANLKELKQPDLFVKLAQHFEKENNAKFIMVGRPAPNESWYIELFKKIRPLSNFEYKGELPIEEVNELLAQSHIFVNTSKYEGFPNTYIQAWMRQVPVVTLNCDPDDVIKSNNIGFHSKTFDQMIKDIKTLMENETLRNKMGQDAKSYANSNFSVSNIDRFVSLLE